MTRKLLLSALLATIFAVFSHAQTGDELTLLYSENFDKLTEGSVGNPATTDIGGFSGKLYKDLKWDYSSKNVYEAGGALYVGDGGKAVTGRISGANANGGVVKVSMRVKAHESFGAALTVSVGSTYSATSNSVLLNDGEWHDLAIVSGGGTYSTQVIFQSTISGFYIDDVKVETGKSLVGTPEALQPNKADGTSFTAAWKKAANATDYLLDVYTKTAGGDKEYVLRDEAVKPATSVANTITKSVSGLDESKTYYFAVRARNAEGYISDYSNEIQVYKVLTDLDAPVALPATNVTANSFTANWEAVDGAQSYVVGLFRTEKMLEDKTINIIDEDFSKVTIGTLESVEFGKSHEELDEYTHIPGWYGEGHAFASGHMVLAPYSGSALLDTPDIDLSHDNGAFSVTLNMAEGNFGRFTTGGTLTVKLYNDSDDDNDSNGAPAETKTVTLDKDSFKDYTVTFSKGSSDSWIEFEYSGSDKVYFDNISIAQNLKTGDSYSMLIDEKMSETTSCDIDADLDNPAYTFYYMVSAFGKTVNSSYEEEDLVSDSSNAITVKYNPETSISTASAADGAKVAADGDAITVTLAADAPIAVYNISGGLIARVAGKAGSNTITTAEHVCLVKVGGKTFKIVK